MKKYFFKLLNKVKDFFSEFFQMMRDADSMSQDISSHKSDEDVNKTPIILTIIISSIIFLVIILFRQYIEVLFACGVLFILFYIIDEKPNTQKKQNAILLDLPKIHELVYEALCEAALLIGTDTPRASKSILYQSVALKNGEPFLEYRLRKKDGMNFSSEKELMDNQEIIQSEIDRVCSQTLQTFFSDIQGLYVMGIKERGNYYIIGILPVNPRTKAIIVKREEQKIHALTKTFNTRLSSDLVSGPFFKKRIWEYKGKKIPIIIDLNKYPHTLVIGATGSGKTYALKVITANIVMRYSDCQMYCCDFKGQDYEFLQSSDKYFSYQNYGFGIECFFRKLMDRINKKDLTANRCLLLIDEWNNFLNSCETKKEQDKFLKMIASILHMGRSYKMNVLLGAQVCHAEFFGKARNSFSNYIGLGHLDKESIAMLFYEDKEQIKPQPRGAGYFLQDGKNAEEIIIPEIEDMCTLERVMVEAIKR